MFFWIPTIKDIMCFGFKTESFAEIRYVFFFFDAKMNTSSTTMEIFHEGTSFFGLMTLIKRKYKKTSCR